MSLRGRLLVAEPSLDDPNFHRTVVYLIEHSEGGALGVVLNRPGSIEVREAIPTWGPYVGGSEPVFVGGPVSPDGAICLARCNSAGPADDDSLLEREGLERDGLEQDGLEYEGSDHPSQPKAPFTPITTTIGALDLHGDPTDAPPGITAARVFAGYAGWSGGQLEAELDAGGWYVVAALDDDIFTDRPDELWRAVLARQQGSLRAVAHYPEDPAWN